MRPQRFTLAVTAVLVLGACGGGALESDPDPTAAPAVGDLDQEEWCSLAVPALFQSKQVGEQGDQASDELVEGSRQASERWLALTPPPEVADDVAVLRGEDPELDELDELSAFQLREAAFERVVDDVEERCGFTLEEL